MSLLNKLQSITGFKPAPPKRKTAQVSGTMEFLETSRLIAGLIFIVLMGFRALGGQFSSRQPDGISAAAVYWYACVAVYALVWVAVYIMK